MILVPLFDLKFLFELAAGDAGTSNRRHKAARDGMQPRALGTALFLFLAIAAAHGGPQKVDLGNITCKEFTMLPKDTIWTVTIWLDGYYTDDEDPAVVEIEKLKSKAEQLVAFCTENPKASLLAAAQDALAK
jgi:hypothetical protein